MRCCLFRLLSFTANNKQIQVDKLPLDTSVQPIVLLLPIFSSYLPIIMDSYACCAQNIGFIQTKHMFGMSNWRTNFGGTTVIYQHRRKLKHRKFILLHLTDVMSVTKKHAQTYLNYNLAKFRFAKIEVNLHKLR